MLAAGTTNGVKYTSVIFGAGALGYGEGSAMIPVEIEREALAGNGSGIETIIERKTWLIHPFGYQVVAQGAAETGTHTLAELAAALGNDANFASTVSTSLSYRLRYDAAQTLTAAQKTQACSNIGVGEPDTDFVTTFNSGLV